MAQRKARATSTAGFTLIELLVVIAIIGILSSIVLASLNSARQKGRDARRISDIKQLQLALELYYDSNSAYPPALTIATLVTLGYISTIATDPSNLAPYAYVPYGATGSTDVCSSYHMGGSLETLSHSALLADADVIPPPPYPAGYALCTAVDVTATADFSGADDGKCLAADAGVACFDLKP